MFDSFFVVVILFGKRQVFVYYTETLLGISLNYPVQASVFEIKIGLYDYLIEPKRNIFGMNDMKVISHLLIVWKIKTDFIDSL